MACVVTILVEIFGTLGGAHMNPAVSIAFVIAGNMTVLKGRHYHILFYVIFIVLKIQCVIISILSLSVQALHYLKNDNEQRKKLIMLCT